LTLNGHIRAHWGIENSLHCTLDVAFSGDASRKRSGHSSRNLVILTRIAFNLLKNDKNKKRSIRGKRMDVGWDDEYLLKIPPPKKLDEAALFVFQVNSNDSLTIAKNNKTRA
jgi:hypothetical protein